MRQIPLTKGKYTTIDDKDYAFLSRFRWHVEKDHRTCYAIRSICISKSKWRTIRMHRVILNAPYGVEVDHINSDGLDNRRSNLRLCNRAENQRHQSLHNNNTSGFKGVTFRKFLRNKPYRAQIKLNNKTTHIGCYKTAQAAGRAFDLAAIKYHGRFALTNKMLGLL